MRPRSSPASPEEGRWEKIRSAAEEPDGRFQISDGGAEEVHLIRHETRRSWMAWMSMALRATLSDMTTQTRKDLVRTLASLTAYTLIGVITAACLWGAGIAIVGIAHGVAGY